LLTTASDASKARRHVKARHEVATSGEHEVATSGEHALDYITTYRPQHEAPALGVFEVQCVPHVVVVEPRHWGSVVPRAMQDKHVTASRGGSAFNCFELKYCQGMMRPHNGKSEFLGLGLTKCLMPFSSTTVLTASSFPSSPRQECPA
jgi:hypothetical protein